MSSLYFSGMSICISLKMNETTLICAGWELGLCFSLGASQASGSGAAFSVNQLQDSPGYHELSLGTVLGSWGSYTTARGQGNTLHPHGFALHSLFFYQHLHVSHPHTLVCTCSVCLFHEDVRKWLSSGFKVGGNPCNHTNICQAGVGVAAFS